MTLNLGSHGKDSMCKPKCDDGCLAHMNKTTIVVLLVYCKMTIILLYIQYDQQTFLTLLLSSGHIWVKCFFYLPENHIDVSILHSL